MIRSLRERPSPGGIRLAIEIVLVASLIVTTGFAQDRDPVARMQQMAERLHLTDPQKEQIRPILQEQAEKLRDVRAKYQNDTSRSARRNELKELRSLQQATQKRIDPILTPEQRKEWDKIREERRDRARENFRKNRRTR